MFKRLLCTPRGVEVGVAIPIGCLAPAALLVAVLAGAGVLIGTGLVHQTPPADHVTVRVVGDVAAGGPHVLATQGVPLR